MVDEKPAAETTGVFTQPEEAVATKTNLFLGEHGLRPGWRLLIYLLMVTGGSIGINTVERMVHPLTGGVLGAKELLLQEVTGFGLAFGGAVIMSRIERRPLGVYGLPGKEMFGSKFWLGFLLGLAEISVLIGLISVFGGYSFGPVALQGREILVWGVFHLIMFTFVGLYEEFLFRGYTQFTLADGIGFWPAAVLLSVLFGALHLGNSGEALVGAASIVLIGVFWCFTLKRTGNLWYAVGLHASFDWGESYLYSVPDSGQMLQGHLSNAQLHGPTWLTGGTVGPEGSVFCFLTIGLQFLVVMWLFPAKKKEPAAETTRLSN
ncbi:MAG: type II CAAX endopeptidase family protein [Candidatus Acidiferrum sp.]